MQRFTAILITVFAFSALASAQVPTAGNIFVGYSYLNADSNTFNHTSLNGWNGSLEGKVFPFVGIVADVGGYYGGRSIPIASCTGVPGSPCNVTANSSIYTAMFGPRVSFSVAGIRPFAHVLVGASHVRSDPASDTSLADAFGGGVDFHLIPLLGWRLEGDEVQTRFFSTTQNNFRFSTGLVVHF